MGKSLHPTFIGAVELFSSIRRVFIPVISHGLYLRITRRLNLLSISSVFEPDPSPDPSPDISPDMSIAFESPGFAKVVISSVVSVPF